MLAADVGVKRVAAALSKMPSKPVNRKEHG
jgi:hypothetical protein